MTGRTRRDCSPRRDRWRILVAATAACLIAAADSPVLAADAALKPRVIVAFPYDKGLLSAAQAKFNDAEIDQARGLRTFSCTRRADEDHAHGAHPSMAALGSQSGLW